MTKTGREMKTLITGGSRGIGRAVAARLSQKFPQTIFVNYLQNDEAAHETRRLVENLKSECVLCPANLSNPDDIEQLFLRIKEHTDHLDNFVHCAAMNAFKPLMTVRPNQWDLTLNTDARAFLFCSQKAASMMPKGGKIVAVSSLGARRVMANYGAQGPTKAALEAIVRSLAVELAPKGINVNSVAAGVVDTDSIRRFPDADRFLIAAVENTPCGRIGKPEDVASAVDYLISEEASWICGHTLIVDGGLSLI